ncbi:LPP20 family lipoprotein [Psychrosphaera saromensis]|nr:LPP20 family lipoprotein [Psychrosphaera saromensis]
MWMKKKINIAIVLSMCFCTANVIASTVPDWIYNPTIKDGLAAVDCVKFSGNWSSASKLSSANARIALAQQIEINVESLDETYDSRHSDQDDIILSTKFSSVSKQFTKQVLGGSRIVKTEIVTISGNEYYCALATLDPTKTKHTFELIVKATDKKLEPELETELFEQFKQSNGPTPTAITEQTNKESINNKE